MFGVGKKKERARRCIVFVVLFALAMAPVLGVPGFISEVYAAPNIFMKHTDGHFVAQGSDINLRIQVDNRGGGDYEFKVKTDIGPTSSPLSTPLDEGLYKVENGKEMYLTINVSTDRNTSAQDHAIQVTLVGQGGNAGQDFSLTVDFSVSERTTVPTNSLSQAGAVDMRHTVTPGPGMKAGETCTFGLTVYNKGNITMKNLVVSLELPDEIVINNGSNSQSMGYLSVGNSCKPSFPLKVDSDAESKNYPIKVNLTYLGGETTQTITETFYIATDGKSKDEKYSMKDIDIINVNSPQQVVKGDDFTVNFTVANKGSYDAKNLKITVEGAEGIVNRSRSTFAETTLEKGGTKNYSVTMFSTEDSEEKNHTIKITAEPLSADDAKDASPVAQYTGVFVNDLDSNDPTKSPQLMVENYGFGGTFVQAGDTFPLSVNLYNTSRDHNIKNIKVTVSDSEGVFLPAGGSSSFHLDTLGKKERVSQSLSFTTKPDAEQRTSSIAVKMSYEDEKGNEFTAEDIIAIPVVQDTRLVVDDIILPVEAFVGNPASISLDFYNMGKTTLNNLMITAEGDFETRESISYFAGNVEPGASDRYDFTVYPLEEGGMLGKIIFTYEDSSGDQQMLEKEFILDVMGEVPWMDDFDDMMDMEQEGGLSWVKIGIAAGIIIVIIGIFLFRRYRKRKQDQEMEIDV